MKLVWDPGKKRVYLRQYRLSSMNFVRVLRILTLIYLLKHRSKRNNSGNTSLNVNLLDASEEEFDYLSFFSPHHSFCQE